MQSILKKNNVRKINLLCTQLSNSVWTDIPTFSSFCQFVCVCHVVYYKNLYKKISSCHFSFFIGFSKLTDRYADHYGPHIGIS